MQLSAYFYFLTIASLSSLAIAAPQATVVTFREKLCGADKSCMRAAIHCALDKETVELSVISDCIKESGSSVLTNKPKASRKLSVWESMEDPLQNWGIVEEPEEPKDPNQQIDDYDEDGARPIYLGDGLKPGYDTHKYEQNRVGW